MECTALAFRPIVICSLAFINNSTLMFDNENTNPWKTLTSQTVYDSPWVGLTKHDVLNPSGNPGTYSVIHFKNLAIGILPLDENYNTWIVGQYRYPINQYSWEIPEGGGKLEVKPIESAKRELLEETGISASQWIKIQEMYLSNSASDEYCILYVAKTLSFGKSAPEENEQLVVKKIPFEELYKMVQSGLVKDAMTVAAVLKVKLMILDGTL